MNAAPDIRGLVRNAYEGLLAPGSGVPADYSDCCALGDGTIVCVAVIYDQIDQAPRHPLAVVDAAGGFSEIHPGPAKLLEVAHNGDRLAFASDGIGGDVLTIIWPDGTIDATSPFPGRIEAIEWQAGDQAMLLIVADAGTDTMTLAGATTSRSTPRDGEPGRLYEEAPGKRRIWIYDLKQKRAYMPFDCLGTIWEASWCGRDRIAALWSKDQSESGWYRATLISLDLATDERCELYVPQHQLGHIRGHPDGNLIAFVEAVASDRGVVCGALHFMEMASRHIRPLPPVEADISSTRWRRDGHLHVAGLSGLETRIGDVDPETGLFEISWASGASTCGTFLPQSRPVERKAALTLVESPKLPPRPVIVGDSTPVALGPAIDVASPEVDVTGMAWAAPDGCRIEGILLRPTGSNGPLPLVIDIHGGPVWAWRPCWLTRVRSAPALLRMGVAILLPNPRGSVGQGIDFAAAILGSAGGLGGPEIGDFVSAIDSLAGQGLIDPARVGLTGSSYGGYIAAWLPKTRTDISAAAPISPVSDWFGQHLSSNMPALEEIFLGGRPFEIPDRYLERSPALSPVKTKAPTLILAGERDRCVPLTQALELYRALTEQRTLAELVTYPDEGHSLRGPIGYLDSAARVVDWMVRHLNLTVPIHGVEYPERSGLAG